MIRKLFKRATAVLLILLLLQAAAVGAFAADTRCSSWAELYLSDAKRMFIPEDLRDLDFTRPISRLELAEMAYGAMGYMTGYYDYYSGLKAANVKGENYFDTHGYEMPRRYPDAPENSPFTDTDSTAAAALNACGILLGRGDRCYCPDDSLTRQEAATVLSRMAAYFDLQVFPFETAFTDTVQIADWAKDGIRTVCGMGLMVGMGDGTFSPETPMTCEQTAATLVRLIDSIPYLLNETAVADGLSSSFNFIWMWVENEAREPVFCLPCYWGTYHYRTDYGYNSWNFLTHGRKTLCAAWGRAAPSETESHTTIFDISTGEAVVSYGGDAGYYYCLTVDQEAVVLSKTVMGREYGDWGTEYYGVYGFDGREILPTAYTWEELCEAGYVNP